MPAKFNAIGVIADRLGVRGGAPALRWAASLRSLPRRRAAPARASDRVDGFIFGRLEGLLEGTRRAFAPGGPWIISPQRQASSSQEVLGRTEAVSHHSQAACPSHPSD
jgi:hypothetical protein